MSLEKLIDEYEFTSLSIWGIRTRNYTEFQKFLEVFTNLPGETLKEKGRYFLKEYADLSDVEIESIREILIEENK